MLQTYRHPNPLDAHASMVNYVRFLAEVDETSLKLPKAENLSPTNHLKCISQSPATAAATAAGRSSDVVAEQQKKQISMTFLGGSDRFPEILLREIRAHVLRHRMSLGR